MYKLYVQIWYAVIRILLDASSRYEVVGRPVLSTTFPFTNFAFFKDIAATEDVINYTNGRGSLSEILSCYEFEKTLSWPLHSNNVSLPGRKA